MYDMHMNRIHRSPDAGEGGGSAPEMPAGGENGGSTPSAPEAPQYVSKSDFDSFANEFRQGMSRFQQPRTEPKSEGKDAGPKSRPKVSDYDMQKDPNAWDKYQDDMEDWRESQREIKRTAQQTEAEAKARSEKTLSGHKARVIEYAKENPSFYDDVRKAGSIQAEPEVTNAVFAHRESPAIVHHLIQNRALVDELSQLQYTEGSHAVHQRVGEIAAEIRAAKKIQAGNINAAKDIPPKQNFRGQSPSKDREPTAAERYQRHHS